MFVNELLNPFLRQGNNDGGSQKLSFFSLGEDTILADGQPFCFFHPSHYLFLVLQKQKFTNLPHYLFPVGGPGAPQTSLLSWGASPPDPPPLISPTMSLGHFSSYGMATIHWPAFVGQSGRRVPPDPTMARQKFGIFVKFALILKVFRQF